MASVPVTLAAAGAGADAPTKPPSVATLDQGDESGPTPPPGYAVNTSYRGSLSRRASAAVSRAVSALVAARASPRTAAATRDNTNRDDGGDMASATSVPLTFLDRLEHFTWAWYTLPMATGGLALLLSPTVQPHTFRGLETIGKMVYVWDMTVFCAVTACIAYRFARFRGALWSSLTHPTEALFFGTAFLAVASIISCMARYGFASTGEWLVVTFRALFWVYVALSFLLAVGQYCLLFTNPQLRIQDMTPAWDLPIFPFMLSGTIAAAGSAYQPPAQAAAMIAAGLAAQGLGFLVSMMMYASYMHRMIQYGFPSPGSRPAMFIAVGPPSFTALALLGMANSWPAAVGGADYFGAGLAADAATTRLVLKLLAATVAVFVWSLSLWFFAVSAAANLATARQMSFRLNWWAYIFPNIGFTLAVIAIAKAFGSPGLAWVGTAMTLVLCAAYLVILACHVRAFWRKDILWPGKDEDYYVKERKTKNEKVNRRTGLDMPRRGTI